MKKICFKLLLLIEILCYNSSLIALVPDVRLRDVVVNPAIVEVPVSNNAAANAIAIGAYKSESEKWNEIKKSDVSPAPHSPANIQQPKDKEAPALNVKQDKPVVLAPVLETNNVNPASTKVVQLNKVEKVNKNLTIDERIKQRKLRESRLVNELMNIDYGTQAAPHSLYNRVFTEYNSHIPPVYFKSYYLSLAFKAAKNNDVNGMNAIFRKYNFLNGQNKDGDTILMYAIQNNSLKSARLLLAKGAYVNAVNGRKRTALHYAATIGNADLVKLLLTMGADYTIQDDLGMTPIDYAALARQFEVVQIIKQYNKKE